ncbi:MAG: amino acid adenylation domain-containing protein [Clostridiales bacterium]|nr:amino acid adenylation domain-containing protein [Clostridiales bacterium]
MNVLDYLQNNARLYPQKTAVAFRDRRYSFSELNSTAARLGTTISKNKKNDSVAVFASRDAETAVLFFAAVYADCFYVPIDPDMPIEKICSILEDCKPSVVLGTEAVRELYASTGHSGMFLTLDDLSDTPASTPYVNADSPLYMVYTSGSTGKPKGVLKSHGAMISYIEAYCSTFDFSSEDIIGNQTPFFFDASAKDIYLMLKIGATLEVLPTEMFTMPPTLIEYLNERKITFISWVPTALSIVIRARTFSYIVPQTLKKVFFVGEVMPVKYLNKWRETLPELQYVNLYGQSELAGICCYYEVTGDFPDDAVLPMGKVLKNCRIYLLDGDTVITENDRTGEMYIVSDALALEYFGDPEKTAKSFLIKDFGNGPVRCFRTGDLAQYNADHDLVFVSRADFQIKHMGHRIELGEIEAVAGSLAEIDRCCCTYDKKKEQIILYCVLQDGFEELTGKQIQSILRPKLSSYMLPSRIQIMDTLPINANGKIDRRALQNG